MKLFFSPYFLTKKNTTEKQEGVLVKCVDGFDWGVADVCPHLHLGDSSWKKEIVFEGPLFQRALDLAQEDLNARKQKLSLLLDKPIANNYLITDLAKSDLNNRIYTSHTVKVKGGRNFEELAIALNAVTVDCKFRIDFNAQLTGSQFEIFIKLLAESTKNKIQYIEDPTQDTSEWKKWNSEIPLASDFCDVGASSGKANFKVFKPSREKFDTSWTECIFTSAMDHPVGIAHGLRVAQQKAKHDSGFLTLDLYEENSFYKYFTQEEHLLNFSREALQDYGIGMTEQLQKLNWIERDGLSL